MVTSRPASRGLRLRILLWRLRHVGAAAALLAAALLVARTVAPPPAATASVVVLARDVPAHVALTAQDVRTVRQPVQCAVTAPASDVVGRSLAVPLPAGLPLAAALLAGDRFTVAPPEGTVVVPVHLADGAAGGLLRPGDRLDLVRSDATWDLGVTVAEEPAGPQVLAHGALVVEVGAEAAGGTGLGLVGDDGPGDPVVLVAVSPSEGRALASASGAAVGAVLVG